MSKVALSGNVLGTGTVTLASPNTNSTVTLNLPAVNGTLNTSGAVNEVPAGTVSAPSIFPTGDTNTGIFFPAADTIAFTEGGVESMRIDSSGNVGVGVTPSAWGGGAKALQIGSYGAFSQLGTTLNIGNNFYYDGTNSVYVNTATATLYQQSVGQHRWYTAPSGTAGNAISFSQKMLLDSSALSVNGVITTDNQGTSSSQIRAVNSGGTFYHGLDANTGASFGSAYAAALWHTGNFPMIFATNNQERMRITGSGLVGIGASPIADSQLYSRNGTSGAFAGTFANFSAGGYGISIGSDSTTFAIFYPSGSRAGGGVGSITTNGTNTTYGTSSDYRLKNITGDLIESGAFIDALKPKVGTWKSNGSPFVGFLAHEFAEVSPSSVSGEKDAVDKKGNPEYQGMQASSSEVMANIIAELQSLRKRVAELENK
jgi:hypothetical protein